jgi:hypothetical protein
MKDSIFEYDLVLVAVDFHDAISKAATARHAKRVLSFYRASALA